MLKVKVIVGSTREGRFSEALVPWIDTALTARAGIEHEVLDLREYDMPFYDQPVSPASVEGGAYAHEIVRAFAKKIDVADAFVIITPEYNHGYSAVLKNALDSVYGEWNKKIVSFIAYGSLGGGRAVEQLREVAVELQMASTRSAVHINAPWALRDESGTLKDGVLDEYDHALAGTLDQLEWWGNALKTARAA